MYKGVKLEDPSVTKMEEMSAEEAPQRELSTTYVAEKDRNLNMFDGWTESEQLDFIENLLLRVCHYQHGQINEFLTPMLQRDFITLLPSKLSCDLYPYPCHSSRLYFSESSLLS